MDWPSGEAVIEKMAAEHPEVILAFSAGKDSLGAWLAMRGYFSRILPVYYYGIPGLEFIEQGIRYYEDWFQTKIVRCVHPSFYRHLREWVFQSPEGWRVEVLEAMGLADLTHEMLREHVAWDYLGLDQADAWVAIGTRAADSPVRRMAFNKHGPIRHSKKTFFPVWDWSKDRLVDCIRESGCKLVPEYRIFGRSYDGIDFRFLHGIRKHWPEDYKKILFWFPMATVEFLRHEFRAKRLGIPMENYRG